MSAPDDPPVMTAEGGATVSRRQLGIHKSTEALSVFVGVPLLVWVATRSRKLTTAERSALALFAGAALVVDGWLLARWPKKQP